MSWMMMKGAKLQ